MKTEDELRAALAHMHAYALRFPGIGPYMSIPARPDVDADIILEDAIKELVALRAAFERLTTDEVCDAAYDVYYGGTDDNHKWPGTLAAARSKAMQAPPAAERPPENGPAPESAQNFFLGISKRAAP